MLLLLVNIGDLLGTLVFKVGRDEESIRHYIRHQEKEDKHLEQMHLWMLTKNRPPKGGPTRAGARRRPPLSRFERLTNKAPGFLPEDACCDAGGAVTASPP